MNFGDKIQIGLIAFSSVIIVVLLLRNTNHVSNSINNINNDKEKIDSLMFEIRKNLKQNDSLTFEIVKIDGKINGVFMNIEELKNERRSVVSKYAVRRSNLSKINEDSLKQIALIK